MKIIKKILIVDDKPENLVALEAILKNFDAQIIKANSGNEALTKTIEHDFALALIDVQMPEMDGFEIGSLLRQVEKTKLLPVIFLSAIHSEDQFLIQGIEAGVVDFIIKPFLPRILQGKVKIFLDLHEQKKRLEIEIEQRKQTELHLRETEKNLIEAKLKAEESDRLKTAFLANMSHEIRTPLTTIVGFAGLLCEKAASDENRAKYANYIYRSSEGLIAIINDILDIAKIEAGHLKIKREMVDINYLLNEIFSTFKVKLEKMNKSHIQLKLNMPEGPAPLLMSDEGRLRQIITNFLGNASKFTSDGSIEFGYRDMDEQVEFFVKDTGIGIPEDKFGLIFDRFQKLEDSNAKDNGGTGLGLSIVKKLVQLLDGEINVTSKVNEGSCFSFRISYEKTTGVFQEDMHAVKALNGNTEIDDTKWNSKSILVVEDEYSTYVLLESYLSQRGMKVKWARNGREAIEIIQSESKFDAVLMDIRMPVLSGIDAFIEIRKFNREVPVIAQTAYALAEERDRLREIGFNGYITKPIIKKDLFKILNTVL